MTKSTEPSGDKPEATDTVTVTKSQLQSLLDRIDRLEAQKSEDVEISTDLPQAQALQPGQYVNIAPNGQSPDLRKVRWSRTTIEKTYPSVPLTPRINITVAPHGIAWELRADVPVDVPSIVRDFHDAEVQRIKHQFDRYRPESPMEIMESIQRSKENPGVPVWGRLHIVGHGLNMGEAPVADVAVTETKA